MAYSLNDVYRSLRTVMRFDGITVGVGLGLLLLVLPDVFVTWQAASPTGEQAAGQSGSLLFWPYRMAGAGLIALGLHLLFAAQERMVRASTMLAMLAGNGLIAVVLLIAFLQREFAGFSPLAQILMGAVFVVCIVSAGFALRYLREDYNMA